jgi:hypothetical protein
MPRQTVSEIEYAPPTVAAVQAYTTTVVSHEDRLKLDLLSIPRHSFIRPPKDLPDLLERLDATLIGEVPDPVASFLPHAIACILSDTNAAAVAERLEATLSTPIGDGIPGFLARVFPFAQYCSFAPIVPVEHSDMAPEVLAAIVGVSGTVVAVAVVAAGAPVIVAIGAAAGTVVILSVAAGVGARLFRLITS